MASINVFRQFIELAKKNQGLIMGATGKITEGVAITKLRENQA